MNSMKRIISVFLAVIMTMAMALTVFAEPRITGTGNIVIKPGDRDMTSITYNAYKVMDASKNSAGAISYTMDEDFVKFFQEKGKTTDVEATAYIKDNQATLRTELQNYISENSIEAENKQPVAGSGTNDIVLSDMPSGYYIVVPSNVTDYASNLTTVINEDVTVYVKGKDPEADKKADNEDWTSAQVGDVVNFTVESTVPDMTGKTEYYFELNDTMSKGLTIAEPFEPEVTIGGEKLTKDTHYTVTVNKNSPTDGETSITIAFKDFIDFADKAGKKIVFKYSATLNENAITTDKETNKASVSWGNTPSTDEESKEDSVIVKDYDLTINKVDGEENPLPGAEFQLFRKPNVASDQAIKFVDKGNGTYEVATTEQVTGAPGNGLTIVDKVVSPEGGKIVIKGLDSTEYLLKETKAPDGYNKAEDQDVTIVAESEDKGVTVTVTGNEVKVVNEAGTILPGTGGIGTIIFTVVAVVLIAGVAVSFIISRRKEA